MKPLLSTGLFCTILLTSCDCLQVVSGVVIDQQTNKPIEGAFIYKSGTHTNNTESNSEGEFELSSVSGGFFGCPPMTVNVKKEGYDSTSVEIKSGGNRIIKLRPLE